MAKTIIPVTPVLSTRQDQLTKPEHQIAYIIRHAVYNPGWTSSYFESRNISLRKLFAEYSGHLQDMAEAFRSKLNDAITNEFGSKYRVEVDIENEDLQTQRVKVRIINSSNQLVLSTNDIRITNGNCYIIDDLEKTK